MRYLLPLLLLAGCSRPLEFKTYADSGGEFSADVPANWRLDERGPFSRKPIGEVRWIGKIVDEHEGEPFGAILTIRRISRSKKDFKDAKAYAAFKKAVLDQGDALAAGKSGVPVGKTEKGFGYNRAYEQELGGGMHGPVRKLPMRIQTEVRRSKDYDWVLEFRATEKLFSEFIPAFERLTASFELKK